MDMRGILGELISHRVGWLHKSRQADWRSAFMDPWRVDVRVICRAWRSTVINSGLVNNWLEVRRPERAVVGPTRILSSFDRGPVGFNW
jgi:hypothetical protein